jgi:hypothetical protein
MKKYEKFLFVITSVLLICVLTLLIVTSKNFLRAVRDVRINERNEQTALTNYLIQQNDVLEVIVNDFWNGRIDTIFINNVKEHFNSTLFKDSLILLDHKFNGTLKEYLDSPHKAPDYILLSKTLDTLCVKWLESIKYNISKKDSTSFNHVIKPMIDDLKYKKY